MNYFLKFNHKLFSKQTPVSNKLIIIQSLQKCSPYRFLQGGLTTTRKKLSSFECLTLKVSPYLFYLWQAIIYITKNVSLITINEVYNYIPGDPE